MGKDTITHLARMTPLCLGRRRRLRLGYIPSSFLGHIRIRLKYEIYSNKVTYSNYEVKQFYVEHVKEKD